MDILVSKSKLRPILAAVTAVIVAAGVAVEVLKPVYGLKKESGVLPLLSLSYEQNLPTFYTAFLLLSNALLLALLAQGTRKSGGRFAAAWWVLAAGFFYIAVDEVLSFHEELSKLMAFDGVLHFSWVIPAAILVLLIGAAYIPFLRHLPRSMRNRFLLAGAVYVGGAVGMELPLGWWTVHHGTDNLGYGLIDALEEAMEMLGLNLFLLALLDHLAAQGWSVRFVSDKALPASP